jgi:hypothetical protein
LALVSLLSVVASSIVFLIAISWRTSAWPLQANESRLVAQHMFMSFYLIGVTICMFAVIPATAAVIIRTTRWALASLICATATIAIELISTFYK